MQRRSVLLGLSSLVIAAPFIASCASKGSKDKGGGDNAFGGTGATDIGAQVARLPEFKVLSSYLRRADLNGLLAGAGPYTLFAPTDNAFGTSLKPGELSALRQPENKAKLVALMKNHIVAGRIDGETLMKTRSLRNLAGRELNIVRHGQRLEIGTADVTRTNLGASNGYIHEIDEVLVIPSTNQFS